MPTIHLTDTIDIKITSKKQADILHEFLIDNKYRSIRIGYTFIHSWYEQHSRAYDHVHATRDGAHNFPVTIGRKPKGSKKIELDIPKIMEQIRDIMSEIEEPRDIYGDIMYYYIGDFACVGWDNSIVTSIDLTFVLNMQFTRKTRGALSADNIDIIAMDFCDDHSSNVSIDTSPIPYHSETNKTWEAKFSTSGNTIRVFFIENNLLLPMVDTREFAQIMDQIYPLDNNI